MQLLLEQSAADSSTAKQQNPKGKQSSGKTQSPKASSSGQGVSKGGAEGSRLPEKKKRKKSSSVERVSPEAAKQAEIWAAAGDAAATAAAAAAAAAASAAAAAAGASTSPSAWPGHRPTASSPQAGWRNQAESYPASAGGSVTSTSEDGRRSPTSAVYSPPQRSAMNAASTTLEQDALRERLKRGERQPVHPPGLGNQRALKKAEEQQQHQQQASRQQEFQGNHHLRLAVSEAPPQPGPPTANIHGLRATASLASSQTGGDGTIGRPLSSQHPTVQHRHSPSGPSFSNQQQQQQQQRSYQQTAAPTGPPHQNRQAKVTYIHMPSATHGSAAAQSANAGDGVVGARSPSPRLHPATSVDLARAGEVRNSRIGPGGSGGGAGLLAASRGQSSWSRAEGYSATGGPVPGNPSPRAAGYGARSPVSSAGGMVPGFGAIGGGVGVHRSVSSEAKVCWCWSVELFRVTMAWRDAFLHQCSVCFGRLACGFDLVFRAGYQGRYGSMTSSFRKRCIFEVRRTVT